MNREPTFVLDASISLAWCFADEANDYADQSLDRLGHEAALVPSIWPLEVGNALVGAERRARLSTADSVRFLELLRQLPIHTEVTSSGEAFGAVLDLAREQRLSTCGAAYLHLAMRAGLPLATQDEALIRAAARCGVTRA